MMKFAFKRQFAAAVVAAAFAPALPAAAGQNTAAPAVIYDISRLPAPVRHMREQILQAAKSGNIDALRPLLRGATQTLPGDAGHGAAANIKQDPINYLKEISADGSGLEILANLAQILQSGAVKQEVNGQIIYVWPYFAAVSPKTLSPKQTVEAYQIMSVDDLDTIKEIGRYIYFRAGIGADGSWRFFLTGDDGAAAADKTDGAADENGLALPNRGRAIALPDDSGDLPEE